MTLDGFVVLALQMLPILALTAAVFAFLGWSWRSKKAIAERLVWAAEVKAQSERLDQAERTANERKQAMAASSLVEPQPLVAADKTLVRLEAELREAQARQLSLEKELLRQRDERIVLEEKLAGQATKAVGDQVHHDDLTVIRGVGPVLAKKLKAAGVYSLRQVAEWTPEDVAYWDGQLSPRGRASRDEWVNQARILLESGS